MTGKPELLFAYSTRHRDVASPDTPEELGATALELHIECVLLGMLSRKRLDRVTSDRVKGDVREVARHPYIPRCVELACACNSRVT